MGCACGRGLLLRQLVYSHKLACFAFTTATYRPTNFSLDDYHGFVWSGNIKVGPKLCIGTAFVVPYGVVDWTWSPRYEDRWFENFVRVGGGVRVYPWGDKPDRYPSYIAYDLARRLHIFAEVVQNVAWLGESAPSGVHGTDVRIGIGFSTGGFFAEPRR